MATDPDFSPGDSVPDAGAADPVAQAAARWVSRQDRGLSAAERAELAAWQAADPRHAAEWQRQLRTWRGLDRVGADAGLAAMADEFLLRARARRARARWQRAAAWSGSLAAALVLGWVAWTQFGPAAAPDRPRSDYAVLASTLRRETLPDGSVAELNGASRIEVVFTAAERRVVMLEGEAHFVVAKNPARPFYVTAGPVTVRAVGTAFNVRLAAESIEVLVTEGKVRLEQETPPAATVAAGYPSPLPVPPPEAPALVEGQRAVIARTGATTAPAEIGAVGKAEIEAALGWQATRLVFNNTPLDEVIAGFNRYHPHRLVLGDPRLRERTLTGVFRADNLDGFVRLLRVSVDVRAEPRGPDETVLLPLR
jgi:transmembrane sensor